MMLLQLLPAVCCCSCCQQAASSNQPTNEAGYERLDWRLQHIFLKAPSKEPRGSPVPMVDV